jgi:hypothetical protein
MTIEFRAGWDTDNTATPKMSEADIAAGIKAGLEKLNSQDVEFKSLKNLGLGASGLAKIYVSKGLHQEQGNQVLAENHVTLEIAEFPNPKRFHMFFWYVTVNKVKGWHPNSVTYIKGNNTVTANL